MLLTGNGTLFVNNTFVEWAAVQALRRAQPRILVTRFGVRDKLKPFSSLLLFSQPRASDQIPMIEDPVGSFVDVEQLSLLRLAERGKEPGLSEQDAVSVPGRRGRRDAGDPIGRAGRGHTRRTAGRESPGRLRHDGAVAGRADRRDLRATYSAAHQLAVRHTDARRPRRQSRVTTHGQHSDLADVHGRRQPSA